MDAKHRAAEAALNYVRSGMTLGLGTGSTAKIFIDLLGRAVTEGRLAGIRGVPTSVRSDEQARALGLNVVSLVEAGSCDLTIDGADEVDPQLNLIKGLGGALLREKIVAQHSRQFIIIADDSKEVRQLGTRSPLPVEVTRFAHEASERFLRSLGCTPELRLNDDGTPYVTDNGNYIYHCRFERIDKPEELDRALHSRAGIVETGLFIGLATRAIIASASGAHELLRPV